MICGKLLLPTASTLAAHSLESLLSQPSPSLAFAFSDQKPSFEWSLVLNGLSGRIVCNPEASGSKSAPRRKPISDLWKKTKTFPLYFSPGELIILPGNTSGFSEERRSTIPRYTFSPLFIVRQDWMERGFAPRTGLAGRNFRPILFEEETSATYISPSNGMPPGCLRCP